MHPFLRLFLLVLLPGYLCSQQARAFFQGFTAADGLGAESINDVLTDRFGYVWTAAFSGVHRYDGYEFVHYPSDLLDSCTVSNPIALKLLEDSAGQLWVATSSGLNRLDRATGCFHRYYHHPERPDGLPDNEVIDLALDGDSSLVALTKQGPARYRSATDDFVRLAQPHGQWQRLFRQDDRLLCAGPEGLWDLNQSARPPIPFATPRPEAVNAAVPRGDSLLIATNQGLYLWYPGAPEIRRYFSDPGSAINDFSIQAIVPAKFDRY
ncbi:MAG: hypothetical protein AAFZ52_07735, partial [Bacteroidota bacterium]